MTLKEIYFMMEQAIESSCERQLALRRSEPEIFPGLNAFMETFGRDEFVISGCTLKHTEGFTSRIEVSGTGILILFPEAESASVELRVSFSAYSGFRTDAFVSYGGDTVLRLADICELPRTPWNSGSVVQYLDSVLAEIRLCDLSVWITANGCSLYAKMNLQNCGDIREYVLDAPYDMLCYGRGEAEAPGGGRERFKLELTCSSRTNRIILPLYKNGGAPIQVSSTALWIQTHCLDERDLHNYAADRTENVRYVSQAYFGCVPVLRYRDTQTTVFFPIGTEGSHIEFYGKKRCTDFFDAEGEIEERCGDELICDLIGCKEGALVSAIKRKLEEMFGGDRFYTFLDISVNEYAINLRFCMRERWLQGYMLESIYFAYAISVRPGYCSALKADWIIEGYLTEYNLMNRDLENFEMVANLQGGNLTKLLPAQFAEERYDRYMRGMLAQFGSQEQRFTAESCFALGQPMEEPETVLRDWSEGFGRLPGEPSFYGPVNANSPLEQARANAALKVSYFKLEGSLQEQSLTVFLTVDTGAVLHFSIGKLAVSLRELTGYVNYTPQNTGIGISGTLRMGFTEEKTFDLFLGGSYESVEGQNGVWTFEAALVKNVISLTDIVNAVMGWQASFDLEITDFYVMYSTGGTYALRCAVATRFPLFGGTVEISVAAEVAKASPDENAKVTLSGQVEIQYFLFAVTVELHADSSRAYRFLLQLDELLVTAVYEVGKNALSDVALAEQKGGVLTVSLKNFTIGALITALFHVLRPNEGFTLPKPWDILNRIGFPEIKIVYHVDTGDIEVTLPINIDLFIIRIEEVGFTYQNREGDEEKFNILVRYHSLLPIAIEEENSAFGGSDYYLWDAFHESAPSPMAESSKKKFELKYFGIGRHIDLGLSDVKDMPLTGIVDICKKHVKAGDLPWNKYNSDYGWYVGAQFRVLEFLDVSLLFYDPVIYGLQAVVLNNDVVPLKGLDITIYYRKVTEDIGVFYVNVGLPDCIKHMEFGALSITLPSIEVWIYTNGNFKINFGFPDNMDFSRCFALSYGIFYGRGGFYFGYLSGDTSANVPATTRGYFDPVIELGIGITIGVGKSFSVGILKLRAQLELTGVFEGVFAKFHAYDESVTEMYYRCKGTVIIAGEISGEIDFFIIKAGFRIYARAAVSAVLESGEATVLAIEASFGVSAYVKIWIFKISFSFSYTYRDTFVLGHAEDKPWKAASIMAAALEPCAFDWTSRAVFEEKRRVFAYLTPYYSRDNLRCYWSTRREVASVFDPMSEEAGAGQEKIAVLAALPEADFKTLMQLLAGYVIGAQERADQDKISALEARELLDALTGDCPAFALDTIYELFALNLTVAYEAAPCSVLDDGQLRTERFGEDAEQVTVPMPFVPVYGVSWYTRTESGEEAFDETSFDLRELDEARQVFSEYIRLIAKCVMQRAFEHLEGTGELAVEELLAYLTEQSAEVGGMVSRFLLNGNRRGGQPLYDVIGQQFPGLAKGQFSDETIVHRLTLCAKEQMPWISENEVSLAIAEGDLDYPDEELTVQVKSGPAKLPSDRLEPVVLSLYDRQAVYTEDKPVFFLWKMPAAIRALTDFTVHAWNIALPESDAAALDYRCAALLDITVRKDKEGDVYSIISASEETRAFLKTFQEQQTQITDVRLLFGGEIKKSGEEKPKGALYFEEGRNAGTWLIRQNLSEITTAPVAMRLNAAEPACVSLADSGREEFFALLHKMLLIGGEGHYLRVGGAHLASELFGDDGQTTLYILVHLTTPVCANRLILTEDLDSRVVPVVKSDALGMQSLCVLKPGKIGFELVTEGAGETQLCAADRCMDVREKRRMLRENLTSQAFTILYYTLDGGESLPVSMQNDDCAKEGENYYSHIMDVPRYPSLVKELSDAADPYAGILPEGYARERKVERRELPITFYFADVTGNSIGKEYGYEPKEPLTLAYTDAVLSISELPMTQVSYRIEPAVSKNQFLVRLSVVCEQGESVEGLMARCARTDAIGSDETVPINLEQYAFAYYQYAQPDVTLSLDVKIGEIYVGSAVFDEAQKEALVSYLYALYGYAKAIKEGGAPVAPNSVALEFAMEKDDFSAHITELALGKLTVCVTTARDARYVEKSGRLPHMDQASGEAGADCDLAAFCLAFERAFAGGKLLVGDGLFAAFFPKDALLLSAPDADQLFYALLPFSTKLLSRSGVAVTKLSERLEQKKKVYVTSCINIDMEVWVREFLGFFERILRPANLDYLFACGNAAGAEIDGLLGTKRGLAEALAARVQSLFLEGQNAKSLREAEECLRDRMYRELSAGYDAAGAAAYRKSSRLGSFALAGELYNAAGVESAKIMPKEDYVCFLTAPENVAASQTLSMEQATLRFTHLEDQDTGEWYRFAEPFEQLPGYVAARLGHYADGAPVVLPVPLRKYPTEPVLAAQSAEGVCEEPGNLKWSYSVTLDAALAAQDRVHIVLSAGQAGNCMLCAKDRDLFASLAQFIYDEKEYEDLLMRPVEINENDVRYERDRAEIAPEKVLGALKEFHRQAEEILRCCNMPKLLAAWEPEFEFVIRCEFTEHKMSRIYFSSEDGRYPKGISYPVLTITDKAGQSAQLTLSAAMCYEIPEELVIASEEHAAYCFRLDEIPLVLCQGLLSEVYLKRNERFEILPKGHKLPEVNPGFLYETERTGFAHLAHPCIRMQKEYAAGRFTVDAAAPVLQKFIYPDTGIVTELTAWLGQRMQGGHVAYRPIQKRIRHILSEATAREFLELAQKEWEGKGLEGQEKYFVRLGVRQFAPDRANGGDADAVVLVDADHIVFYL